MKEFMKIKKQFEIVFGFEFLKVTRKREYVEARAAFIYYLYRFKQLGLLDIARMIKTASGWKVNHATIHHAIKNFEMYCKYNPKLDENLLTIIGVFDDVQDKQRYVRNAITKLPAEVVDDVHKIVQKEYTKVLEDAAEELNN